MTPTLALGAVPGVYTNANYQNSTHEKPVYFASDGKGGFYGHTISGRNFTQTLVSTTLNLKIQKFVIDKAFFYISDKGQIWAPNDLTAISIYLARV